MQKGLKMNEFAQKKDELVGFDVRNFKEVKSNKSKTKVTKHKRMLRPLEDSVIVIYIGSEKFTQNGIIVEKNGTRTVRPFKPEETHEIDLNSLMIYLPRGINVKLEKELHNLTKFKNFEMAIKFLINRRLSNTKPKTWMNSSTHKIKTIKTDIRYATFFFTWMVQNSFFSLADLTNQDCHDLLAEFIKNKGWFYTVKQDQIIDKIIERFVKGEIGANEIITPKSIIKEGTRHSLKVEYFSKLGIDFQRIPQEQLEKISEVMRIKFTSDFSDVKISSISRLMPVINGFANHPVGFDSINFRPFSNLKRTIQEADRSMGKDNKGRTENLSLESASKLIRLSLKWIHEYGDGVVELVLLYRKFFIKYNSKPTPKDKSKINRYIEKDKSFCTKFKQLKRKYNFPFTDLVFFNSSAKKPRVSMLVKLLLSACAIMIGVNHGRRVGEVTGKNTGLYYGCLTRHETEPKKYWIDVFVAKHIMAYHQFFANDLVCDSVKILEKLYDAFRYPSTGPSQKLKTNKLFTYKRFNQNFMDPADSAPYFLFNRHSAEFFHLANVNQTNIAAKYHIFRRIFSILYIYRYEHADLFALRNHLGHMSIDMTLIYVTDPKHLELEKSIQVNYTNIIKENSRTVEKVNSIRSEYLHDQIFKIMQGKKAFGQWPKILVGIYKAMSVSLDLCKKTESEQCEILTNKALEMGYGVSATFPHGCCCTTDLNSRTYKQSNCYDHDTKRITHNVLPTSCSGCPHFFATECNILYLEETIEKKEKELAEIKEEYSFGPGYIARLEKDIYDWKGLVEKEKFLSQNFLTTFNKVREDIMISCNN